MQNSEKKKGRSHLVEKRMAKIKNPHLLYLFFKRPQDDEWQEVELFFEQGAFCTRLVHIQRPRFKKL